MEVTACICGTMAQETQTVLSNADIKGARHYGYVVPSFSWSLRAARGPQLTSWLSIVPSGLPQFRSGTLKLALFKPCSACQVPMSIKGH